jgi:predicted RNA-binding Zn-ribbon protein involved in translation (DUF1610 family)
MAITIKCPDCGQTKASDDGEPETCPACEGTMSPPAKKKQQAKPAAPAEEERAEKPTIVVVCTACQARLKAPDAAAGKALKCPKCAGVIRVPSEPPAAPAAPHPVPVLPSAPAPKSKASAAPPVESETEELPPDDAEDAPQPKKKKAPKPTPADELPDDPDEDAPPRKSKSRKGGKVAEPVAVSALLQMAKVHLVPNTSLFAGRKKAFVKDPESGDELGVIRETTFKLFGNPNILGIGPFKIECPPKYEVRDGAGLLAVRIRVDRKAFRFQLSKYDVSSQKWVVETSAGPVGAFVVSQTKGSDTRLLDADGRPAGRIVADTSIARRVVLVDTDGAEIGHVIGERSIENAEMLDEAKQSGKVGKVRIEVKTIFNQDKRGSFAVVNESRVNDPWAHAVVLGFGALVQGAGVFAVLAGAKDPAF